MNLARKLWDRLRGWGGEGDDTPVSARVRAAQIHAVFRFAPLTMAANLVNAIVVFVVVDETTDRLQLYAWTAAVLAVVALTTRSWFRQRGRMQRRSASIRAIRRATGHAALLGGLWAIVPILWFDGMPFHDQLIIACLITGMICAGGFALSAIPSAAYAYVAVLTLGAAVGLFQTGSGYVVGLGILLLVYSLIVLRSISSYSTLFRERFVAEASLKMRGEIIELLLAEFEQNGSDWLFELDGDLAITSHSPRFSEVCGRAGQPLLGESLLGLIHPDSRALLDAHLTRIEPFRDLELRGRAPGSPRWWALTAKPFQDDHGRHAGWRGVGSDVTERKLAGEQVAWMARTDLLTGLPNRSHFRALAAERLARARAQGRPFALGCIDLDQFKSVNDTLGHPVGDRLLTAVAGRLQALEERGLVFGRVGGDEFGLIFPDLDDRAEALAVAERIVAAIGVSQAIGETRVTVGSSIGIAFGAESGGTVDDLIRNADLALYRAKDRGRGLAVVFDEAMHREAEERRCLIEDLRLALRNDHFRLYYQPIVDAQAGTILAFEALIRWQHPTRGLLGPGVFVALAEEAGLIDEIGAWVIRRACLDAVTWPDHVCVAVNLSPAQFGDAGLLDHVVRALAESRLPAARLELEITEALLMNDTRESLRFLGDLRALGVRIALDDFGTGYSSLGYLTRFPIQKLKIDRSFISGASSMENRKAVVEAIVGIARSLDLETTAEGVETAAELSWIRGLGCRQVQGFYYSRPLPLSEVSALIARLEAERTGAGPVGRAA